MRRQIPCAYQHPLQPLIASSMEKNTPVIWIDGRNRISHYGFSQEEIAWMKTHVFFARIDRAYDMLDLGQRLCYHSLLHQRPILLVTGIPALLAGFSPDEKKHWERQWERCLARLRERTSDIILEG
ncbi:MAG: hypothetical protein Q8P05_00810 [Candidatus Diapherotrites archaeon]|nr:hypothetical protein [Candidatus Diapherotrites archaeon]